MTRLPPVFGHEAVRRRLAAADRRGGLTGSLLLHGPPGVGKQRMALWLAQLVLCPARTDDEPCGTCTPCKLALRIEHPDLHWFFPLARPRGTHSPARLAELLEDARSAELAARREHPLRPVGARGEAASIFLAQVHTLRRLAARRPAMGSHRIFIIGDAERLVPQESSQEAANALLKLLEEPPTDALFVLTAAEPDALLPTMKSRLRPLRLRPLPLDALASFLVEHKAASGAEARRIARLAYGSIGVALGFLPNGNEPGPREVLRQEAKRLLEAALAGSAAPRYAAALAVGPTGARGGFVDLLDALAPWLRDLELAAAGAADRIVNTDAAAMIQAAARHLHPAGCADAVVLLEEARAMTANNINPQLLLAWLLQTVHRSLRRPAHPETVHAS